MYELWIFQISHQQVIWYTLYYIYFVNNFIAINVLSFIYFLFIIFLGTKMILIH